MLCNLTRDPWYCDTAAAELRHYAAAGAPDMGYHCYEIVLAFAAVRDSGLKGPAAGLRADGLKNFTEKVMTGCGSSSRGRARH